jgi:hypothetical protein
MDETGSGSYGMDRFRINVIRALVPVAAELVGLLTLGPLDRKHFFTTRLLPGATSFIFVFNKYDIEFKTTDRTNYLSHWLRIG